MKNEKQGKFLSLKLFITKKGSPFLAILDYFDKKAVNNYSNTTCLADVVPSGAIMTTW